MDSTQVSASKMNRIALLICALGILNSGCVSPIPHENAYTKDYRSVVVGTREQVAEAFYPPDKNPRVIHTNVADANAYFRALRLQGYYPIGFSGFYTALSEPDSDLIETAKSVQADLVVTLSGYAGRRVVNLPYENQISSGGFSTTNTNATLAGTSSGELSGDVNGAYSGTSQGVLTGTSTTYTPPQYSTTWVPTTIEYEKVTAVFMRRATGRPIQTLTVHW